MTSNHVVIVGAGISGLACAYHIVRLARQRGTAARVTLLEQNSRPGGRVWTDRVQGFSIETGANGFLDSKRSTLQLCEELGLGGELIPARPEAKNRYLFWQERLHKLPGGLAELLRSRLLSVRGKLRLFSEVLIRPRRDLTDESVHQFARRRIGQEAAEVLVDAMVTGIHAGDPELLSAPAAFPRMVQLEREYGSLLRAIAQLRKKSREDPPPRPEPAGSNVSGPGGTLWSIRSGMGRLIETLAQVCGAQLVTGVQVSNIRPTQKRDWLVQAEGQDRWSADALVLACPSFMQAQLTEALDPELAKLLAGIAYTSVVVVALGYRRSDLPGSLDGFGYLVPQRLRRDVLGVLWSSSIFDGRAPHGMVQLRVLCGGWNRPEIVGWADDRIVRAVRDELRYTMHLDAPPALVHIVRWPQAIPQYHLGHLERVAAIEQRRRQFPKLYLTGNSLRGVSVNDCTEEALRCAQEVSSHFG